MPALHPLLPGGNPFGETIHRNQLVGIKQVNDKLYGVTKAKTGYLGTKVIPVSCPTTLPIHQSCTVVFLCVCVGGGGGKCVGA